MSPHMDPCQRVVQGLRAQDCDPLPSGAGIWAARCPVHQGSRHNLTVSRGGDGRCLVHCHHANESGRSCSVAEIVDAIGLTMADLFPMSSSPLSASSSASSSLGPRSSVSKPRKLYATRDAVVRAVALLAEREFGGEARSAGSWTYPLSADGFPWWVLRYDGPEDANGKRPKMYRPIHQGPNGWAIGDPSGRLPLYRVNHLDPNGRGSVFVVEGEKCVLSLIELGLQAVTSAHGAGSPHRSDWSPLAGRDIIVWRDLDRAGLGFARQVFGLLAKLDPPPSSVRSMSADLLGMTFEGADAADYVDGSFSRGVDPRTIRAAIEQVAGNDDRLIDPARHSSDALLDADANVKPSVSVNVEEPDVRVATLADLRQVVSSVEWVWPGWIPKGVVVCIGADPGKGKTRLLLDLATRIWRGREWPDGAPPSLPPRSATLWVCGDRQFSQLAEAAPAFGLPDEALMLAADPAEPTRILDLDAHSDVLFLADAIRRFQPALTIIDTIGNVTSRNLTKPQEARQVLAPLMDVAAQTASAIILVTHLSMDGNALGRRIEGACRTVIKLTEPDPEIFPGYLKIAVSKSAWKKPDALGAIAGDGGFRFGETRKPTESEAATTGGRGKPGPAPANRDACKTWLRDRLSIGPDRLSAIIEAGKQSGYSIRCLYDVKKLLGLEEFTVSDDHGRRPRNWWRLPADEAGRADFPDPVGNEMPDPPEFFAMNE